jgi:hypothetical protein
MPPTLRHAHITVRRGTEPQQVARLRAAAAQRSFASCEIATG